MVLAVSHTEAFVQTSIIIYSWILQLHTTFMVTFQYGLNGNEINKT